MAGFSQETLDLHELTRQGKNFCECGTPKQMYYKPWCPLCEKPEIETIPTLNWIQCCDHIEALTGDVTTFDHEREPMMIEGYKDRMKDLCLDPDRWNNDTIQFWGFCSDDRENGDLTEQQIEDIDLFISTFGLEEYDHIYLDISW